MAWGTARRGTIHRRMLPLHDGNHTSKDGKTLTNDCSACHNLLAVDEANPKQLADLGLP